MEGTTSRRTALTWANGSMILPPGGRDHRRGALCRWRWIAPFWSIVGPSSYHEDTTHVIWIQQPAMTEVFILSEN
jgi:hypothetical protein